MQRNLPTEFSIDTVVPSTIGSKVNLVFAVFAAFAIGTTAQARSDSATFQEVAVETLMQARLAGLETLDGISMKDLLEAARAVLPTPARIEVGDRKGALWTSTGIFFDPDRFRQMPTLDARVLSVHEYIGHHYGQMKDDGYPYSIYITLKSTPRYRKLLENLIWPKAYTAKTFATLARSGGSTVVGGGGDGRDIHLKMEAIEALNQMLESGKTEVLGKPLRQIFSGLLFVNFYRSDKVAKEHFNLYLPSDMSIQPVVLTHPETFAALMAAPALTRIIELWKLASLFYEKVL